MLAEYDARVALLYLNTGPAGGVAKLLYSYMTYHAVSVTLTTLAIFPEPDTATLLSFGCMSSGPESVPAYYPLIIRIPSIVATIKLNRCPRVPPCLET